MWTHQPCCMAGQSKSQGQPKVKGWGNALYSLANGAARSIGEAERQRRARSRLHFCIHHTNECASAHPGAQRLLQPRVPVGPPEA